MTNSPKLVKRRKIEEDPDAQTFLSVIMDNRPPEWNLTEAQKKVFEEYKQGEKPLKSKIERHQQSFSKDMI